MSMDHSSAAKTAFEITSVTTSSSDDLETSVRQPTSADAKGSVESLQRKASEESQDNTGISEPGIKVEGATSNKSEASSAAMTVFEVTSVSSISSVTTSSSDDLETSVRQPTSADAKGSVESLQRKASEESQDNAGISEPGLKIEGATSNKSEASVDETSENSIAVSEANMNTAPGGLASHAQTHIQGVAGMNGPNKHPRARRFKRVNNYSRGRWVVRDTAKHMGPKTSTENATVTPTSSPIVPRTLTLTEHSETNQHSQTTTDVGQSPLVLAGERQELREGEGDCSSKKDSQIDRSSTATDMLSRSWNTTVPSPIAVSSTQEDDQNYTCVSYSEQSQDMSAVGTNSAEYRTIQEKRPQLVTTITRQVGVSWFSEKLEKIDFITSEQASGITSKLGVSDEDKVSSLLEAVESKIKSNQRGTPFSDFVEMLESEERLQDMGQALQFTCQMIKEQASRSEDVISRQITVSGSEAKPSLSTRYSSMDPRSSITSVVPSSPKLFAVGESNHVYVSRNSLPEEDENSTNMVDAELAPLQSTGRQQVDVAAPSAMVQTSTVTRTKDLQDYVNTELSAISGDVANKDSQISDLKEQLQEQLQQKYQLEQRVEEQEKQMTTITEEKEKLETDVQKKTEELTQTKEQLTEKACKLEECKQNLSQEKQAREQLQQQLNLKKAELERCKEQLADKEKEFNEVRSEKKKEIAQLRKALEEKTKAVEECEERMTELRAEQQNLKLKLQEKHNELLQARLELAQKDAKLANTKAELTDLQAENKIAEAYRSCEATIAKERRNSEATIAELRAKLSKFQSSDTS